MKKKKLKLNQLKVSSFTTDTDKIKGGDSINVCLSRTFQPICFSFPAYLCDIPPTQFFSCNNNCTLNANCTFVNC